MSSRIAIREVSPDDLDSIALLNRGAVPAVGALDERGLWRLVEMSASTLVATDDGHVIAFLVAFDPGAAYESPNYRFFADRYASFRYIDRVVVDPHYARQGIGRQLYETLELQARTDGVWRLTAEVNVRPPNQSSLAFHADAGFVAVGEQDTEGGAKRVRLLVRDLV